jgi:poly(3-hydroxybutyrate) depolymerase
MALAIGCSEGAVPGDAGPDADAGRDGLEGTDTGPDPEDSDRPDAGDGERSWVCNPTTGLDRPLPACTSSDVCLRPGKELGVASIDSQGDPPLCRTTAGGRPVFDDGPPLAWTGADGITRYACRYRHPQASPTEPRPLVVFLHGGNGTADTAYDFTSLRSKAEAAGLSGDPARAGFHLLTIHGRNVHYPTLAPRDGRHHDFYFRDLASPSSNPDIANLDRLIDDLAATGEVDGRRIYLMGWSNGGFFSQMYGIGRHVTPTPGGNRVAAVVAFTAADPFHNIHPDQDPSCQLAPYPTSALPILLIGRACDVVACDEAQAQVLRAAGFECEPGHVVGTWEADLAAKVQDPNVERLIVSGLGDLVQACTHDGCTPTAATLNHVRWPDGIADRSGNDHEPALLDFLARHPLP